MNKMTPSEMNVLTDFLTTDKSSKDKSAAPSKAGLELDFDKYEFSSHEEIVAMARREQAKYLAPIWKSVGKAIKGMFKFMFVTIYRDLRSFRTVSELSRLSDRELADLGITRWDIPRIARENADLVAANEAETKQQDVAA